VAADPDAIHARVSAEKGQFAAQQMERRRNLDRLLEKAN
jgi:hypothetical protein